MWSVRIVPAVVAWLAVTVTTAALLWPMPLTPNDVRPVTAFLDSYAWCLDHVARMVTGEIPLAGTTDRLAYPETPEVRFVAWLPALAAVPLRAFVGPIGAANLAYVLSPGVAALAAYALYRRLVGAGPWAAAGGAVAYALCPVALGCLASGQLAKLQHWALPAWALAVLAAAERPRWLVAVGALTLAIGFTSPIHAMFLPFVGLGLAVGRVRRLVVVAIVAGIALLPALRYYSPGDELQAFAPANADINQVFGPPSTVAQPAELLLGTDDRAPERPNPKHVSYLGIPAVALVLLLARRFPGRGATATWLTVGTVLAFGPGLAAGNTYLGVPLPAEILVRMGYPLADSGMWYRTLFVAALGVGGIVAGGAGRVAIVLGPLLVLDGVRVSRELWPLRSAPIEARATLEEMARDPVPGAVLDLPLAHNPAIAGAAMLRAVIHGRAILPTARIGTPDTDPYLRRALDALQAAVEAPDLRSAHQALRDAGFRYVVLARRARAEVSLEALEAALGAPGGERPVFVWRVDPDAPSTGGSGRRRR